MNVGTNLWRTRHSFSSNEHRIRAIRVVDGKDCITTLFRDGAATTLERTLLRFGEPFRLQVDYECLMAELPDASCGVAAAFRRTADMQSIAYFNTNYPHSDDELRDYYQQEFRRYVGRRGTVEAYMPKLQLKPDEYLLTVGILPNRPTPHEFYELHYLQYPITVLSNGRDIPAAFYPNVTFTYGPIESGDEAGDGANRQAPPTEPGASEQFPLPR